MLGLALLADSAGWIAVGGFLTLPVAGILFFTHSKKHWLTIRGTDGLAMLRLDKSNYRRVIPALENQTGITVAQQGER